MSLKKKPSASHRLTHIVAVEPVNVLNFMSIHVDDKYVNSVNGGEWMGKSARFLDSIFVQFVEVNNYR